MASTNPYMRMARVCRFTVSVSSTSCWKPSFSSMVATGTARRSGEILAGEVTRAWKPRFYWPRRNILRPLFRGLSDAICFLLITIGGS